MGAWFMKKVCYVSILLAVMVAAHMTYPLEEGPGFRLKSNRVEADPKLGSVEGATYNCGRFGNRVYRFPKALTEPFIQYIGDQPWSPEVPKVKRSCKDEFRGTGFLACLPDFRFQSALSEWEENCRIFVSLSNTSGDKYLEEIVKDKRLYRLESKNSDFYDGDLELYRFDVDVGAVQRIFWRARSENKPYVYGKCTLSVTYPQCDFKKFSAASGAAISVSFPMHDIRHWEEWLNAVESKLLIFQVVRLGGE